MPTLDDLVPERRERVEQTRDLVVQMHEAIAVAEPGLVAVFDLIGSAMVSLTARAEYVEQRLDALEHPDRNDHA